jgi:CyaY protein
MHSWYPQYSSGGQVDMEAEFRKRVQQVLDRIEKVFENVDPDRVECEHILGALTLIFPDRSKCILSTQPSVQQIWLALAAKGTAFHFSFDPVSEKWIDDKGRGVELMSFLEDHLKEVTGIDFKF